MTARKIATGTNGSQRGRNAADLRHIEFWLIGTEVYRVTGSYVLDIYGLPQSRRWECSLDHWNRFRKIYDWVEDV